MNISKNPDLIGDTIVFEDGGNIFLYSQNQKKVARLKELNRESLEQLKNSGFFANLSYAIVDPSIKKFSNLMLLLGRNCIMGCIYCYANAGINKELMDQELADRAVALYLSARPEKPKVTLFGGGEPTLNIKAIKKIIEKYNDKTRWVLTTCGVISKHFLEWLIIHNVDIGFSIDGPAHIHNYLRPLKSGRSSSHLVENSIAIWKQKSDKPLTVRTTITAETVNNIEEILDYFSKLDVQTVHLEALYNLGRVALNEHNFDLKQPSLSEWINAFIKALEWGKRTNRKVKVGTLSYLFNPSSLSYCGPMSGRTIVVNHQGFLTACSEVVDDTDKDWDKFCIGKINNRLEINEQKFSDLAKLTINEISDCQKCFARYICRGGCAHKRFSENGDLKIPDQRNCELVKTMIPILVKRMATGFYL